MINCVHPRSVVSHACATLDARRDRPGTDWSPDFKLDDGVDDNMIFCDYCIILRKQSFYSSNRVNDHGNKKSARGNVVYEIFNLNLNPLNIEATNHDFPLRRRDVRENLKRVDKY